MGNDRRNATLRNVATTLTLALTGIGTGAVCAPHTVHAYRQHVVRAGQSLDVIARSYGRTAAELAAANGLNLDGILRKGQVLRVPDAGVVYVVAGQTLSEIAEAHHVGTRALAKANHIDPDATLQIGQKLVIPGRTKSRTKSRAKTSKAIKTTHRRAASTSTRTSRPKLPGTSATQRDGRHARAAKTATASKARWGKPKRRGVVNLYRLWSRESLRVRLVDSRGRARQDARRALRELLRPRNSRRRKTPHARLLRLLARVSDHFGGRTLHVVSGYRLPKGLTRKTSRHVAGRAVDFRIPGVPLTELRDFCLNFSDVGVGYYPTTQFVHLDVRDQPARWTDWSLPGQPPVLTKPASYDENHKEDRATQPHGTGATAEHNAVNEPRRPVDAPAG